MKRAIICLAVFAIFGVSAESQIAREMLAAHNAVRSKVGVPPLAWSEDLAHLAQNWADTLLANGKFEHRPNNPYGENIYEATGFHATPADVVGMWAAEASHYDYKTNRCRGVCGHYTQVVWRDTKQTGCGVARNARREVWVCDYEPPGNIISHRPY